MELKEEGKYWRGGLRNDGGGRYLWVLPPAEGATQRVCEVVYKLQINSACIHYRKKEQHVSPSQFGPRLVRRMSQRKLFDVNGRLLWTEALSLAIILLEVLNVCECQ